MLGSGTIVIGWCIGVCCIDERWIKSGAAANGIGDVDVVYISACINQGIAVELRIAAIVFWRVCFAFVDTLYNILSNGA